MWVRVAEINNNPDTSVTANVTDEDTGQFYWGVPIADNLGVVLPGESVWCERDDHGTLCIIRRKSEKVEDVMYTKRPKNDESALSSDALARVEALKVARDIFTASTVGGLMRGNTIRSVDDIVSLSEYIVGGWRTVELQVDEGDPDNDAPVFNENEVVDNDDD